MGITNINFNEFRSSTATAIIFSEIVSIVQLYVIEDQMDIETKWMEYIFILCGGFIGLFGGNVFARYYLNQSWFQWFIMYMIMMGGIVLSTQEIWTPLFDIVVTATLLIAPCVVLLVYFV